MRTGRRYTGAKDQKIAGSKVRVWGIEGTLLRLDVHMNDTVYVTADLSLMICHNGRHREVSMEDVDTNEIEFLQEEKEMSNIKVSKERIDRLMKTAEIKTWTVFGKCTIVAAKLENGFIITESSACVDPANFDAAMGERICKDKIRDRLWELEGYALQKGLHKLVQEG